MTLQLNISTEINNERIEEFSGDKLESKLEKSATLRM
jgi:hypothetical protein